MIDWLVSETLDRVDIRTRYPDAFERLLASPDLHELFVATLESFEAIPPGTTTPEIDDAVPATLPSHAAVARPTGEPGVWQAQWKLAADLLNLLFQPPEMAFRDAALDEEDRWITLLRDEVGLGAGRALIVLDGRLDDDGQLVPELKLAFEPPGQTFEAWGLLAWALHRLQIKRTRTYRTPLPPLALDPLLAPDSLKVQESLSLALFFRIPDQP